MKITDSMCQQFKIIVDEVCEAIAVPSNEPTSRPDQIKVQHYTGDALSYTIKLMTQYSVWSVSIQSEQTLHGNHS